MPLLRAALNPVLDRALSETATRLNEDEAALWARAEELFEQNRFKPVVLKKLSPALAWRFAGITAQRHIGPGAKRLSRNALCRAVALEGEGGASGPIDLGFGIAATWSGELGLRFETQSGAQAVESEFCETLLSPGKLNICHPDGTSMVIEAEMLVKGPGPFEVTQKQMQTEAGDPLDTAAAYFDADVLSENELVVRSWMAGDSMKVWKRGSRKVKKLFQERSLPQFIRLSLPVVEWGIDLIWIPGVARSEVAPVTDETTQVLKLSYRRE
jgi:tRNA(Ile)-lysidine synthetase-like protein